MLAVIGGSIPFILFFSGLAQATGPGAALIHKTLFIWVAVLAVVFLRETPGSAPRSSRWARCSAARSSWARLGALGVGSAEVMILAATLLWSVEVVVARRLLGGEARERPARRDRPDGARRRSSSSGSCVAPGRIDAVASFSMEQWAIVAATGVLLIGYVTTWYAALQRAPASLVTSVLVGGAVVTGVLAAIRTGTIPAPTVGVGLALLALGVGLAIWRGLARPGAGSRRDRRAGLGMTGPTASASVDARRRSAGARDPAGAVGPWLPGPAAVRALRLPAEPARAVRARVRTDVARARPERRHRPGAVADRRGFEGAYPYLELIASENGIADPLDARVVEAYWLGNDLLEHVGPRARHDDLSEPVPAAHRADASGAGSRRRPTARRPSTTASTSSRSCRGSG